MEKKRLVVILLAVLIGGTLLVGLASLFNPMAATDSAGPSYGDAIGVIYIEGTIQGGSQSNFFGESGSDDVLRQLREAQRDMSVDVVILRINSPGGVVAATQEIHREVIKLKEAGKKVVVSMGDVAASGGYWVAVAADLIVANPGTITGSIGVIMEVANLTELYEKLGLKFETLKSGDLKDIGSSSRDMTPREREILQGMVDDMQDQFVAAVAAGRNLPRDKVEEIADGRVFTGSQALKMGLVDREGNFYDAVDMARELAGITGEPYLKEYRYSGPSWFQFFFSQQNPGLFTYFPFQILEQKTPYWR